MARDAMCLAPSVLAASTIHVTIRICSAWVSTVCSARVGTGGKVGALIGASADAVSLAGRGEFGIGDVRKEEVCGLWMDTMGTCEAFSSVGLAKGAIDVLVAARLRARTIGDAEQSMWTWALVIVSAFVVWRCEDNEAFIGPFYPLVSFEMYELGCKDIPANVCV